MLLKRLRLAWPFILVVLYLALQSTNAANPSALWNRGARCVNTTEFLPNVIETCRPFIALQNFTYIDDLQDQRESVILRLELVVNTQSNCTTRASQLLCAMIYKECYPVDVPGYGVAPLSTYICQDFCQLWRRDCTIQLLNKGYTPQQADMAFNCTTLAPFWRLGPGLFPNGTFNSTVTVEFETPTPTNVTINVTLPCYDRDANLFVGFTYSGCPEGTHNSDALTCTLDCPEPLISDSEYDDAELMLSIVGWFSFIGTAFVVVSFMLSPMDKLAYPSVLSFFFTVCIMCLSFTFCLGSMVGHEEIWCKDEFTPNRWGDGWCTIQGITYVFFTLAGGLWWLSISINLIATVVFQYKPNSSVLFSVWKLKIMHSYAILFVCHVLCWGIPLLVVIITLSAHRIGYGGSDFWCSIHSDENIAFVTSPEGITTEGSSDAQAIDIWNLVLLTIPMILITLIGTILFIIVIIVALIRSQEGLMFFLHQWRLLALVVLYIWIYSFVFSAHLQFSTQRKQQYEDYADYIECLKLNSFSQQFLGGSCELTSRVNYALWFIASFNVAAGGFFVFIIFGTSKGVFMAWANVVVVVFTGGRKNLLSSSGSTDDSISTGRSGLRKIIGMPILSTMSGTNDASYGMPQSGEEEATDDEEEGDEEVSSSTTNTSGREEDSSRSSENSEEGEEGVEMKKMGHS